MTRLCVRLTAAVASVLALASCERKPQQPAAQAETADAFVERLNHELADLSREQSAAGFAYATFINVDTEFLNAKANERVLGYFSGAVEQAKAYKPDQLSPNAARSIQLLKLGVAAPAPADATKRAELA